MSIDVTFLIEFSLHHIKDTYSMSASNEFPQFLSEKVFSFPSILKDNFAGYRITD